MLPQVPTETCPSNQQVTNDLMSTLGKLKVPEEHIQAQFDYVKEGMCTRPYLLKVM